MCRCVALLSRCGSAGFGASTERDRPRPETTRDRSQREEKYSKRHNTLELGSQGRCVWHQMGMDHLARSCS